MSADDITATVDRSRTRPHATMKREREAKPFSRKGLHRFSCPMCPCYGYFTVALVEDVGLPPCFAPGCPGQDERMQPDRLELAIILEAWHAPVYVEYVDLAARKEMGQYPAQVRNARAGKTEAEGLANMWDRAATEITVLTRERARGRSGRRIARPVPVEAMPF
jgi:hypothetical protein